VVRIERSAWCVSMCLSVRGVQTTTFLSKCPLTYRYLKMMVQDKTTDTVKPLPGSSSEVKVISQIILWSQEKMWYRLSLPTRWRRKPAGIDMNRDYVTVALCNTADECIVVVFRRLWGGWWLRASRLVSACHPLFLPTETVLLSARIFRTTLRKR